MCVRGREREERRRLRTLILNPALSPPPPPLSPSSTSLHASLAALKGEHHRAALAVDVPLDLVAAVDAGTHPDDFTAGVFARAHRGNQLAAGKAAALGALSAELLQAAKVAFPEPAAEYAALTTTDK